jgi:hypothetical protein
MLRGCALGLVVLLVTGCSSFHREWDAAAEQPVAPNSIEGCWQGTWRSDANGHTDALRCLITRGTSDSYSARFHAKYRKVFRFSFSYTVPLTVTEKEGALQFEGAADLGWLAGGNYTYKGRATATNFFSTYSCKYDHGVFEMTRPKPEK